MKFSDFRGADALDLFADLLDPIANIASDEKFRAMVGKSGRADIARYLLKDKKADVLEILAKMNGTTVEEYNANAIEMLSQLMEIINDKEFVKFFQSQGLMAADVPFGSATENTTGTGNE